MIILYSGNQAKYHTRWNGPFIGFDFDYRFGCAVSGISSVPMNSIGLITMQEADGISVAICQMVFATMQRMPMVQSLTLA